MDTLKKIYGHKYFMPGMVLLIVLGIAWYNKDALKKMLSGDKPAAAPATDPNKPNTGSGSGTAATTPTDLDKVLKNGDKGAEVKTLQTILNTELTWRKANPERTTPTGPILTAESAALVNEPALVADGNFGAKTEARLNLFTGSKTSSINALKTGNKMKHLSGANYSNLIARITNPLGTPTNTGGASGSW
jgi:hypothetical protein